MPEEGEVKAGKQFLKSRWRTASEIHRMAGYTVTATIVKQPRTLEDIANVSGLAEINAKRALNTGIEDGIYRKFTKDGVTFYQWINILDTPEDKPGI